MKRELGGRLGYGLPWLVLAALPLFSMIAAVDDVRF
jgi:hypothetical protein